MLERFFHNTHTGGDAKGIVSPHAGYLYSGQTAAHSYASVRDGFNGTFIVIGPSHQGFPTCISQIAWDTPLGPVENDTELGSLIDLPVHEQAMAFGNENSLEMQIPIIRFRFPGARIVPVMMGLQTLDEITRVSGIISAALREYSGDVKIVASSDFSHFVTAEKAKNDDLYVIEALKDLNVPEFLHRIQKNRVTACGYGPVGTMIESLRPFGISRCDIISYTSSGEITGDFQQVVAYAALAVN
jgi:AmmeMemoRadiSam system protein B